MGAQPAFEQCLRRDDGVLCFGLDILAVGAVARLLAVLPGRASKRSPSRLNPSSPFDVKVKVSARSTDCASMLCRGRTARRRATAPTASMSSPKRTPSSRRRHCSNAGCAPTTTGDKDARNVSQQIGALKDESFTLRRCRAARRSRTSVRFRSPDRPARASSTACWQAEPRPKFPTPPTTSSSSRSPTARFN